MHARIRALALALVLGVAACGGQSTLDEPGADGPTILEVDNRSNFDMTIHVMRDGGGSDRLGIATAHLTTRFEIPERLMFGLTSLRFRADPVGSDRVAITRDITVEPGGTVVMQIPVR